MKKFTLLVGAAMILFSATSQEVGFVPKQAVAPKIFTSPILDGVRDDRMYNSEQTMNVWLNEPVASVTATYRFAYDETYLYVYSEIRMPEKTAGGHDEISITIGIDEDRAEYSFAEGEPNNNGFLFSKITFGGTDDRYAATPGEMKTWRNVQWVYQDVQAAGPSLGGYNVEARIAWNSISTNQSLVEAFKARGTFYFDIAYKFGNYDGTDTRYVAWSNDDNNAYRYTDKAGFVKLMKRNEAVVPSAGGVPVLNARRQPATAYPGDPIEIANWNGGGAGLANTTARFWFSFNENNFYVYAELHYPEALKKPVDEIGITFGIEKLDWGGDFAAGAPNDNGFLFSKLVFGAADGDDKVDALTPTVFRGMNWIWNNADLFTDGFTGYKVEGHLPWASITTNQSILNSFRERGSMFFDIGFKVDGKDENYFAWSNIDNQTWRRTWSAGRVYLEGYVPSSIGSVENVAFEIWPNPVRGKLNINADETISSVEIINLVGQQVLSVNMNGINSLDVSSLKKGMYLVKVLFMNGQTGFSKILVE